MTEFEQQVIEKLSILSGCTIIIVVLAIFTFVIVVIG